MYTKKFSNTQALYLRDTKIRLEKGIEFPSHGALILNKDTQMNGIYIHASVCTHTLE